MEWSGRRTGSRVSEKGRPQQAYGNQDSFSSADNFQHPQNNHSHRQEGGAGSKEKTLSLQSNRPSGPQNG